jgi:hypothetical protein
MATTGKYVPTTTNDDDNDDDEEEDDEEDDACFEGGCFSITVRGKSK